MTIQLVNSENLVEFVRTGKVPEFKPPGAETPAPKAETPAAEAAAPEKAAATEPAPKAEAKAPDAKSTQEPARNEKGQFTKQPEGDKTAATAATAGDDGEEDDLPERAKARIDKKHRAMKEAEEREQRALRRAEEAERRAAEAERRLRESKSEPAQAELTPPKPEDFKSVAEYADALVDFKLKKREADERKQREAEQKAELERAFQARMVKVREKHSDFEEVMQGISGTDLDQVPTGMIQYIQESDLGPDLLYHLAKHPTTLDRIRKLSTPRMFAELGKLEDKLSGVEEPSTRTPEPPPAKVEAPTKIPERQVSKAPAPIAPLETAGVVPVAKKPEEMSVAELREFRRQQELEKRSVGRA